MTELNPARGALWQINSLSRKYIFLLAKFLLFIWTIWYLYKYVWLDKQLAESLIAIKIALVSPLALAYCTTVGLLVFANWGLEALKWKYLLDKFYPISFGRAFAGIMSGTAVSLWTPNRSGEYLGRLVHISPPYRIKSVLATLIGSAAQLVVTLILGGFGLVYYVGWQLKNPYLLAGTALLALVCSFLLLLLYFRIHRIRKLIPKKEWTRSIRHFLLVYKIYNTGDMARGLLISLLRYAIFCTQFILLIHFFGVSVAVLPAMLTIFMIYLVQTAVPSTALTELGMRGVTSVFFMAYLGVAAAPVLAASYTLWLINIILPGLAGLFFLLLARLRTSKS